MPIANRPDPNYEPDQYDTHPDGKYKVNGLAWITNDEEGAPIFVASKGSQPLVARYRTLMGEEDGPPGSVSPGEVAMLVKALGGDQTKLPDREEDPTAFLIAARDQINTANKETEVVAKGGWVQSIKGMHLPVDKYFTFSFVGIATKKDDVPTPVDGTYGQWFGVNLEVVGDLQQRATTFDGYQAFCFVNYALVVTESGEPAFQSKKNGEGWSSGAVGLYKFIQAFCPTVLETTKFKDPNNILSEIETEGRKAKMWAVAQVVRDKKGRVSPKVGSLQAIDQDRPPMPGEKLPERHVEEETKDIPLKEQIEAAINTCAPGAFDTEGKLTSVGKSWCRENLKAFLKENSWPARMSLWTEEIQTQVLVRVNFLTPAQEDDDEF